MTSQQTPPSTPRPPSGDGPAAAAAPRTLARGLSAVLVRNEFYRDGYRVLQSIAITQAIIICLMAFAMLFIIHINQKEIQYFALNRNGTLVEIRPLNEPSLDDAAIRQWARDAVVDTMSFGFNDLQRRFAEASEYFTPQGYANFIKVLDERKFFVTVQNNKQVVNAIAESATIRTQGTVEANGVMVYQWIINVPATITYQSIAGGVMTQKRNIELRIVRTPLSESPRGIGILQWIEREGS